MTRIRATCPTCGEVDLQPDDIELHVVRPVDDPEGVAAGSSYTFFCAGCEDDVVKPADARIARLLTTGGVPIRVEYETVGHPENPPAGSPLTYDDLLDFHLLLQTEDWLPALTSTMR